MKILHTIFILFSNLFVLSLSYPICTDSRAPTTVNTTLKFCPYDGSTCCSSREDFQLQEQFESLNISDPSCASIVKAILCARCDPFSGELFKGNAASRPVPILCNSIISANSSESSPAAQDFCSEVWNACKDVYISKSPFVLLSQVQAEVHINSKLSDHWQSKTDFCDAYGATSLDEKVCFSGRPVNLNKSEALSPPSGLCLEKIGNGSFLDMVAHPDGSDRAFFANQAGKVWLATTPPQGSGGTLELDESVPFIDLTDQVHSEASLGLMGLAFHPNFTENGRFFASFSCDSVKFPGCAGRCACNLDVGCDPSEIPSGNGTQPCRYQSVIAEYSANGSASKPSLAKTADQVELRRILTVGLPFTSHPGGKMIFGPRDGYLYCPMGDGGGDVDPYNLAQNKKSLLGKILRIDVDNFPTADEITNLGLWGNYSIPKNNPYTEDKEMRPEIWALGLRNPWRCTFDSERPYYFMCGDIGTDRFEEVDIITKGGNYGWRDYEGPYIFSHSNSTERNTSEKSKNPIFPVLGYDHSEVNNNTGLGAIAGGYFYRSMTDPCLYGRYLYGDLYGGAIWAGTENPRNSGKFTTSRIPFTCAEDSPIQCSFVQGSSLPDIGLLFSFGEDNHKDNFILTSNGVYRVVPPSRCNYTCSKAM